MVRLCCTASHESGSSESVLAKVFSLIMPAVPVGIQGLQPDIKEEGDFHVVSRA